jgi:hypothetical protein
MKIQLFLLIVSFASTKSLGHSGGLDTSGGHLDRSTGLYHCNTDNCSESIGALEGSTYSRDDWRHWVNSDGDCQDTRAELLIVYSRVDVEFRAIDNCVVESGEWPGLYSAETFQIASDIDIDHVIPLLYASQNGGFSWSIQKKESFANDSLNLLAVSSRENRKKGAKGPAQYLPNKTYECSYVKRWIAIAAKYELVLAFEDTEKIAKVQKGCE